jgi:molybdopterin converting factor small subunit
VSLGEAIEISVSLGSGLGRQALRGMETKMRVPRGTRIVEILSLFDISPDAPLLIARNGMLAAREDTLEDGDTIALFPPVGGGA